MTENATHTYRSVSEIREANRRAGQHWFEPDTMRFFSSRVGETVYGGRFFISSEVPPNGRGAYTIRVAADDGHIETVEPDGDDRLCAFSTRAAAESYLRREILSGGRAEVAHDPYPGPEREPDPRRCEWRPRIGSAYIGTRDTRYKARRFAAAIRRGMGYAR